MTGTCGKDKHSQELASVLPPQGKCLVRFTALLKERGEGQKAEGEKAGGGKAGGEEAYRCIVLGARGRVDAGALPILRSAPGGGTPDA